jgi:carbon storage regulator
MLVLSRKTSQVIKLGEDITITVVRTSQGSVKLGIEAPPSIRITRTELCAATGSVPQEANAA